MAFNFLTNVTLNTRVCIQYTFYYKKGILETNLQIIIIIIIQVNEKFLRIQRRAYRDGVKRRETRRRWSGCCHGDELRTPRMHHTFPIILFHLTLETITSK